MGRYPRMYRPDLVYESTSMTMAGMYGLRPCEESTELILGVVGRALAKYPSVRLHALNPLSTHWTELLSASNPPEISQYLCFVKTNVSKELMRLHGIDPRLGLFEKRRARVIPISPHPASVESRFRYALEQGTKEDLVESPRHWLGVSGAVALEKNRPLVGRWYDRTAERKAKHAFDKYEFSTEYAVRFSPLPHWQHLKPTKWKARVTEIIDDITAKALKRRGDKVLGYECVTAFSPTYSGPPPKRTRAPRLHAVGRRAFDALKAVIVEFTDSFFAASEQSRNDDGPPAEFPPFSFPPGAPMTPGTLADLMPIESWADR